MTATAGTTRTFSTGRRAWVVFVMCLGVVLVISTMTSLYTAIPDLAEDTGASQKQITWIIDAYTLVFACLLLPAGALGDRYGRRRTLIAGLVVFLAASVATLASKSPDWIVLCRVFSGLGAAFIMPSTLSLITTVFPASERGRAVGIWSASTIMGGAFGLMYGGALLEVAGWTWIIVIGAVGAGVMLLLSFSIPTSKEPDQPPLDLPGTALGALTVGLLVFGLIEAPGRGWTSPPVIGCALASIVGGIAFAAVELRTRRPLLDVRLLRNRVFGSGALMLTIQFAAGFGYFFVVVQFLQYVEGRSPFWAAFSLAPMAITLVPLSLLAPALTQRIGMKAVAGIGTLFSGAAYGLYYFIDGGSGPAMYWFTILLLGIGYGVTMACGTTAIIDSVPDSKQGVASAVNDATREVGAAIGVAFGGSLLASGYTSSIEPTTATLPDQAEHTANESIVGAFEVAQRSGTAGEGLRSSAQDAFVDGMHLAFVGAAGLMLVTAVILFWTAPGPRDTARLFLNNKHTPRLFGLVRGPQGMPVHDARVSIVDLDGQQAGLARTDAEGRYEIPTLAGGHYLVVGAAEEHAPAVGVIQLNGLAVEHNMLLGVADVPPGGDGDHGLFGVVRAGSGVPVAGATVVLRGSDGAHVESTRSGPSGGFEFAGLAAGNYSVGTLVGRADGVAVPVPSESAGQVTVLLSSAGRVEVG